MQLAGGGIDVFYIDESHDTTWYAMTAIAVPFLRPGDPGWSICWPDHLAQAQAWRKLLKAQHGVPTTKELHGLKLASGRGNYDQGKYNFKRPKAGAVYRAALASLDQVVPDGSILTVAVRRGARLLYGRNRLEAALYALLQRMRSQCVARNTNAMVFFDQGHPEYRRLYRQAQRYLPTGSRHGVSRNLPLDMFTKDGNEKDSRLCYFTQIADLVAYSAFIKMKSESGLLQGWQAQYSLGNLYDSIPRRTVNTRATNMRADGIVRLA